MATRGERRSRAVEESWADTSPDAPSTPQKEMPQPESTGKGAGKKAMPFSLLSSLPSPARNLSRSQHQQAGGAPPSHAPTVLTAPSVPAPPTYAPTGQWEAVRPTAEPALGSYRDRLRAGGMGAFQRAMNAGLMPKAMKNEWNPAQMNAQGYLPQQPEGFGMPAECQQAWCGAGQMPSPDCLGILMNQPQMPMQQQQQMVPSMPSQPMQYFQVPQAQATPAEQTQMMNHMQAPQMQMPNMQLPPMQMCDVQEPVALMSGESTPVTAKEPQSPDDLVAQLKAMAESQGIYED